MIQNRLENEIAHGKKIVNFAGEVWGWETPAGKVRWARRVKMLTANISPGMKILEIGCGTGYFTKELAKTGADILAVDISDVLIEKARKDTSASNVEFRVENAYELSTLEDSTFDAVIGSSVLHHLEIQEALKQFHRILKPNGFCLFTEPNMLNPQIAIQKNVGFVKERMGDSPDETAFFKWQIRNLLNKNGFENVSVTSFDFLHPSISPSFISIVSKFGDLLEKIPLIKEIAGSLYIKANRKSNVK